MNGLSREGHSELEGVNIHQEILTGGGRGGGGSYHILVNNNNYWGVKNLGSTYLR